MGTTLAIKSDSLSVHLQAGGLQSYQLVALVQLLWFSATITMFINWKHCLSGQIRYWLLGGS